MRYILIAGILFLSACTTPTTMMKNQETGQVEKCGGNLSSSLAGGVIGYWIQRSNDADCRLELERRGFKAD